VAYTVLPVFRARANVTYTRTHVIVFYIYTRGVCLRRTRVRGYANRMIDTLARVLPSRLIFYSER